MAKITQRTARFIAKLLEDKKANDILVLDVRKTSHFTSFFVICTGTSTPHLKALRVALEDTLKKKEITRYATEGAPESRWILLDYGDIMVHIFQKEARAYYNLERMWGDAKIVWKSDNTEH